MKESETLELKKSTSELKEAIISIVATIREKFGEGSEKSSEKILALIKENKSVSAREMAVIVGISQRAVEKQLAILRKKRVLKRVGGAKGGHWEISGGR